MVENTQQHFYVENSTEPRSSVNNCITGFAAILVVRWTDEGRIRPPCDRVYIYIYFK